MQASVVPDYRQLVSVQEGRFTPVPLGGTERVRAVLACFEPGQFIPVHSPGVDMVLVVLEGEGQVVAGEQEQSVAAGAVVIVPGGQRRGVLASSRMVVLHVVTPPPGEADHVEVQARLQQGSWR